MKQLFYFIFGYSLIIMITSLPFIVFTYFFEFRLFFIAPALWHWFILFRKIQFGDRSRYLEFEIELKESEGKYGK
ncbi:hypothetical protein [Streptococcus loxodontisalivarius]|uniref:Uncharacterized protein n=1 Tax=Streptococcus loxodontisalivarius TaxID=1349415 RepID=A0ABS2PWA1_9STRE|nr:hypothetical protein [Streptococcus loxodontisalivarius]MBM7643744.1 hypothetical protein [Streptococcus loxodontisalivarius]